MKKNRCMGSCLAAVLLLTCQAVCAGVKAAFLYGSYQRYQFEVASLAEKWDVDIFESRHLDKMTSHLQDYALAGIGTLATYEHAVDWKKHVKAWRRYLRAGGVVVIWDGNYANTSNDIFRGLDENLRVKRGACRLKNYINQSAPVTFSKAAGPLFDVPHPLRKMLRHRMGTWSHYDEYPGFEGLMLCDERKGIILHRQIGKGHLFVTTMADFASRSNRRDMEKMLENILFFCQASQCGGELHAASLAYREGQIPWHGRWKNRSGRRQVLRGELQLLRGRKVIAARPVRAACEESGEASLQVSFHVSQPGDYDVALRLSEPGTIYGTWPVTVPERLILATRRDLIPPRMRSRVMFTCKTHGLQEPVSLLADGNIPVNYARLSEEDIAADLSALKAGSHQLTATSGKEVRQCRFTILPADPLYAVDGNANLACAGKPLFLLGLYHVSWEASAENRLECLRFAADHGYNLVHVSCKDREDLRPFLKAAEARGVKVIAEGVDAREIALFKESPAVLGWNVMDEPELYDLRPEKLLADYLHWHRVDRDHGIYMVLMRCESVPYYVRCSDVVAHDPYPIPNAPISEVYVNLKTVADCAYRHHRCPVGVLQAFGYAAGGTTRIPTGEEVRNMTYQALAAGVKGIVYYTYVDGSFQLVKHPELLKAVASMPAELKALEPFLLHGAFSRLKTKHTCVFASQWKLDGDVLRIEVNASRKRQGNLKPLEVVIARTRGEASGP